MSAAMEKKLEYFSQAISREVEAKKRRAKHQMANDLSKNAAFELGAAEDKIRAQIEAARRDILRKSNGKAAAATARAKAEFLIARDKARAWLTEEITRKLREFTLSPEYENYLTERINHAKKQRPFAIVMLCRSDSHLAEAVARATGLTAAEISDEFIGGFILQSENSKVLADYTFKTRMARAVSP